MKNVLSFKDEVVLDMRSIPAYKEHTYNLIELPSEEKLLRVAAIYGANASGKSNLYLGIRMFQDIVVSSMNTVGNTEYKVLERCYQPFAFENESDNSEFQIILFDDEVEYKYGFEFNSKQIVSEWLYKRKFGVNRVSKIVERDHQSITIGDSIRSECEKYKKQISEDSLALTFFNRLTLKTPVFQKVFDGIYKMIIVDTDFYEKQKVVETYLPQSIDDKKKKKELLEFLASIDTGIKDISYKIIDKRKEFYTYHIGENEKKYSLNLYNESRGTLKMIMIYIFASFVIAENGLMFVDELNARLHPLLLKFIVDLFYNENSKAQLIYTTHDTTLMDKKFFRRDQILFVQKDDYGYSTLSTLSDFKVRSDASFEKDYLAGVYGGIPMLKEISIKTKEEKNEKRRSV